MRKQTEDQIQVRLGSYDKAILIFCGCFFSLIIVSFWELSRFGSWNPDDCPILGCIGDDVLQASGGEAVGLSRTQENDEEILTLPDGRRYADRQLQLRFRCQRTVATWHRGAVAADGDLISPPAFSITFNASADIELLTYSSTNLQSFFIIDFGLHSNWVILVITLPFSLLCSLTSCVVAYFI